VQNTSCPEISLWYTCHVGGHKADGKGGKLGFPTFPPAVIPLFQEFQTQCMKFLIAFRYNPSLIVVLRSADSRLRFVEHVQEYRHTQARQQMNDRYQQRHRGYCAGHKTRDVTDEAQRQQNG